MKSHFDTPWKLIIERFFRQLMEFFFPLVAQEIDWSKPHEFLDKELLAIEKKTRVGKKIADKLIKVHKINGEEAWIIIHLEIQGGAERLFSARMFEYFYKIYDKYKKPLMSAAILTDQSKTWRPNCFQQALWGCEFSLTFPIIKLIDYELGFLAKNDNPIAKVVQAHLIALKTRGNSQLRFENKLFLVKKLYPLRYTADDIRSLYTFMDYSLSLPAEFEVKFMKNMKHYEEEIQKPYITSAERIGIEKGIEKGNRGILQVQIEKKFGQLTSFAQDFLANANPKTLKALAIKILTAHTIDELFDMPVNDTVA